MASRAVPIPHALARSEQTTSLGSIRRTNRSSSRSASATEAPGSAKALAVGGPLAEPAPSSNERHFILKDKFVNGFVCSREC
jgi:hypothetical protein